MSYFSSCSLLTALIIQELTKTHVQRKFSKSIAVRQKRTLPKNVKTHILFVSIKPNNIQWHILSHCTCVTKCWHLTVDNRWSQVKLGSEIDSPVSLNTSNLQTGVWGIAILQLGNAIIRLIPGLHLEDNTGFYYYVAIIMHSISILAAGLLMLGLA